MTHTALAITPDDVQAGARAFLAHARTRKDGRAAEETLLETSDKPKPAGLTPLLVKTPAGVHLRCAVARPKDAARGTVVLLQGRADYIERHYETIEDLLAKGFAVATFDWRGQGLSQRLLKNPLKGHIRSFAEYDADLEAVMRRLVLPDMPAPYFALAVSMGGHILLRASFRHVWFERAILISPMIAFRRHPHESRLKLFLKIAPLLGLNRAFFPGLSRRLLTARDFEHNPLTSDRRRFLREVRFLQEHPRVGLAAPTIGWVRAALASMNEVNRIIASGDEPRWPMLALAAARDRLVDPEALRRLSREVGHVKATFLHKARHDITQERDDQRALFLAALDSLLGRNDAEAEANGAASARQPAVGSASS